MNIKTFIEDSRKDAEILIDSFCEPKVTNTNEHPNCEYVFTCEEMEAFEKKLTSFTSQKLRELIGEVKAEVEGMHYKLDNSTYCDGFNDALDSVINLIEQE